MHSDLESAFGVSGVSDVTPLATRTLSISSQNHRGVMTYRGTATIRISEIGVELEVSGPSSKPLLIPVGEISGCSMTCFGTGDQRVDLLIPRTGSDLMIQRSPALLDWCWSNKKPMFSSADRRAWQYKRVPLPPAEDFAKQFSAREEFDRQTKASCLGY